MFRELRTALEVGIFDPRRARLARGLSQAQLAEKVGASRRWVVEIEAGKPTSEFGLCASGLELNLASKSVLTMALEQAPNRKRHPILTRKSCLIGANFPDKGFPSCEFRSRPTKPRTNNPYGTASCSGERPILCHDR